MFCDIYRSKAKTDWYIIVPSGVAMYPLSCKQSLRTNFLLELLLSKSFTDYATAESVRAQMPKLNRQTLFAYKFPVPPTEIQEQFSDRANAVYSIQSQQAAATATAQATFDALLSQVFDSGRS